MMEGTLGGAAEEGSLSQDGKNSCRCRMYRIEQRNHSLQVAMTEYLITIITCIKAWMLKNVLMSFGVNWLMAATVSSYVCDTLLPTA